MVSTLSGKPVNVQFVSSNGAYSETQPLNNLVPGTHAQTFYLSQFLAKYQQISVTIVATNSADDTNPNNDTVYVNPFGNTFDWSLPQDYGIDINGQDTGLANAVLRNSTAEVNPAGYQLNLDATPITTPIPVVDWRGWFPGPQARRTPRPTSPLARRPTSRIFLRASTTLTSP